MVQTMVKQAVPLQPMEVHGGAEIHLQPMEDSTLEQLDVPEGSCDPMESSHCSRLLTRLMALWRSPHGSRFAGRTCEPMEGIHAGTVHGGLSPMGGTPCWSRRRM
ncbi:hypothetical protein BTVI_148878 [Pitangus sulphuratus]|nr:hypothetical protein BTVI_148878 [Pitangus sulphuratus]